jgi:hypothetical protein
MSSSIQPSTRAAFITGLRDLAAYLETHPGVPVPSHGADINLHVAAPEDGGRGHVAHIAAQLGASIADETRHGGHLTATRMFGPIAYGVISIPATVMAAHHARDSYYTCVTPDMS